MLLITAFVMLSFRKFHVTSGVDPDLPETMECFAQFNLPLIEDQPLLDRLQEAIQSKLDEGHVRKFYFYWYSVTS